MKTLIHLLNISIIFIFITTIFFIEININSLAKAGMCPRISSEENVSAEPAAETAEDVAAAAIAATNKLYSDPKTRLRLICQAAKDVLKNIKIENIKIKKDDLIVDHHLDITPNLYLQNSSCTTHAAILDTLKSSNPKQKWGDRQPIGMFQVLTTKNYLKSKWRLQGINDPIETNAFRVIDTDKSYLNIFEKNLNFLNDKTKGKFECYVKKAIFPRYNSESAIAERVLKYGYIKEGDSRRLFCSQFVFQMIQSSFVEAILKKAAPINATKDLNKDPSSGGFTLEEIKMAVRYLPSKLKKVAKNVWPGTLKSILTDISKDNQHLGLEMEKINCEKED